MFFSDKEKIEIFQPFEYPKQNLNYFLLTELKQTGSYSTGNGNYSKIPGITGDKNRADWLKKGFGIQFQGNYSKIILKADKLLAEGNKAEANRLYKAADRG